jgi:hypothetical protein
MSTENQEGENDQSDHGDPRRLILPYVNTGMRIYKNRTTRELGIYVPAAIVIGLATLAIISGSTVIGIFIGMIAVPLLMAALALDLKMSRAWYHSPEGVIQEFVSYRRLKRSLPWGHHEAVGETNGIRAIRADGSVKRQDGSQAALIRVKGMNTTHLSAGEIDSLVKRYTNEIEGTFSSEERWWATYSTTRPATADTLADLREKRGDDFKNDLSDEQRKLIRQSAEWLQEQDQKHDANDWRHYIVVEATPEEAAADPDSIGARVDRTRDMLPSFLPFVGGNGQEKGDETDVSDDRIGSLLTKRVKKFQGAIQGIGELDGYRAPPGEHVEVLRSYYTQQDRENSDDAPKLLNLFERKWDVDGYTPTERLLTPDEYDIDGKTIKLDNTYVRTIWVDIWPTNPNQLFLDDLYTMTEVDLDVKMHNTPINNHDSTGIIKDEALDVDAEAIDRAEESELASLSMDSKSDAYTKGYLLAEDGAQAWRLNGYITARASTEDALDDFEEAVERVMEDSRCSVTAPLKMQHECFRSAGPLSDDIYNQRARPRRERIAFSGAIGAMFPFAAADLDEEKGIYWGRNAQTMETIIADPFNRGTAPHIITIGMSRSGKTHFAKEALTGWFLESDDRTLIVADTQSGFHDLTQECDGKHIVIDSKQEINPLHIEPPPQERIDATNGNIDPLTPKINEVAQLLLSIANAGDPIGQAAGSDSGDIYKVLRYVIGQTYERAGIKHDDLSTHSKPSPTLDDFRDELMRVRENAEGTTFLGSEGEIEGREKDIDKLAKSLIGLVDEDDGKFGDGRYSHLRGEGTIELLDEDVRMAYLDLTHLENSEAAEKSIGLQIALSQIGQKIKQAPGQTIFMIDEAHLLYQSERLVDWLQKAVREWARYEACMWSVSQSPEEFVQQIDSSDSNTENKRQVIREQCSTLQVFYSNKTSIDTLDKFGLGSESIYAAKNNLTPGRSAKGQEDGYSECLIQFNGEDGWLRSRVETMPLCRGEKEEDDTKTTTDEEAEPTAPEQTNTVTSINGIGTTYGSRLESAGIETVDDMLEAGTKEVTDVSKAAPGQVDGWFEKALARKRNGTPEVEETSPADGTTESEGIAATDGGR